MCVKRVNVCCNVTFILCFRLSGPDNVFVTPDDVYYILVCEFDVIVRHNVPGDIND